MRRLRRIEYIYATGRIICTEDVVVYEPRYRVMAGLKNSRRDAASG